MDQSMSERRNQIPITNESTTWLDYLPTEIIFLIFNYLSSNDIIYTFFYFNQRFNNLLLQNERYFNYLEFPTTNLDTWVNILSIIGSQIESLNLKEINLSLPFNFFSNLKSLIISVPIDYLRYTIDIILKNKQFQNLHSFQLKANQCFPKLFCQNYSMYDNYTFEKILKVIFNDKSKVKTFQCSLLTYSSISGYTTDFKTNFNLHSLTLSLNDFSEIFLLISYAPNLEYLNVQCPPPNAYQEKLINKPNIKLRQLYLTMSWSDLNKEESFNDFPPTLFGINQIIDYIKLLSTSLICLSLNLANFVAETINDFPFNSIELQKLLESMIELEQFHLYARLPPFHAEDILSRFENQYWFDHKWIFGMHEDCFYTLPFHFDHLHQFYDDFNDIKSTNSEILINNPRIWFNVKFIELFDRDKFNKNFLKQLKIKIPKLESIKFVNSWMFSNSDNINSSLNIISETKEIDLKLNNVTTIEFDQVPIEDRKEWLINELPNLRHLVLLSVDLPPTDSQLAEVLNKRIQRLDIEDSSKLEQLTETSYTYFSNVQYINFRLYSFNKNQCQYYADIVVKILENFQNLKILAVYSCIRALYICDPASMNLFQCLDRNYIDKNYDFRWDERFFLFRKKLL